MSFRNVKSHNKNTGRMFLFLLALSGKKKLNFIFENQLLCSFQLNTKLQNLPINKSAFHFITSASTDQFYCFKDETISHVYYN